MEKNYIKKNPGLNISKKLAFKILGQNWIIFKINFGRQKEKTEHSEVIKKK